MSDTKPMSRMKGILKKRKQKQSKVPQSSQKPKVKMLQEQEIEEEKNTLILSDDFENHAIQEDCLEVENSENSKSSSEVEFPFKRRKQVALEEDRVDIVESSKKDVMSPSNIPTNDEAAWEDKNDTSVTVDILKSSRTKKLKEEMDEQEITGEEYSKRLRKYQRKVAEAGKSELYKWAYQVEDNRGDKSNLIFELPYGWNENEEDSIFQKRQLSNTCLPDASNLTPNDSQVQDNLKRRLERNLLKR
jgi:hypothetical protein